MLVSMCYIVYICKSWCSRVTFHRRKRKRIQRKNFFSTKPFTKTAFVNFPYNCKYECTAKFFLFSSYRRITKKIMLVSALFFSHFLIVFRIIIDSKLFVEANEGALLVINMICSSKGFQNNWCIIHKTYVRHCNHETQVEPLLKAWKYMTSASSQCGNHQQCVSTNPHSGIECSIFDLARKHNF